MIFYNWSNRSAFASAPTSDMTYEGLGKVFEGDFADTCTEKISAGVDGGLSGRSSVHRPGSEDPHGRHRKLLLYSG